VAKSKGPYAILAADFWRNAKIEALSLEAAGLLAKAISYSADQMTDGRVPESLIRAWGGKRTNRIVRELTTVHINRPGGHSSPILSKLSSGFLLNTYLKRNISSEEYRAILATDRQRKQRDRRNVRTGHQPESGPDSAGNPPGSLDLRIKTLLRERESAAKEDPNGEETTGATATGAGQDPGFEPHAPAAGDGAGETPTTTGPGPGQGRGAGAGAAGLLPPPPHLQVTRLWIEVGQEVANDPRVYADPEMEKRPATKLWNMGRELNPADPLAALRGPFLSYWRTKRKNNQWPKMRFMISDFNEHLDASEKPKRSAEIDREYELRQNVQTLHGRFTLLKTEESERLYKKARAEYRAFMDGKKGRVATG